MLSGNGSSKDGECSVSPVDRPAGISGLSLRDFDAEATAMTMAPEVGVPAPPVRFGGQRQDIRSATTISSWPETPCRMGLAELAY
jgi:hypothetical protein